MLEDDLKIPHIDILLVNYLNNTFSVDNVLNNQKSKSAEYQIGYLKAVRDIIGHLAMIRKER